MVNLISYILNESCFRYVLGLKLFESKGLLACCISPFKKNYIPLLEIIKPATVMRRFLLFCLCCISVSMSLAQKGRLPYERVGSFQEDMAMVTKDGRYGFINRDYKEVIPPVYLTAYDFSEGVAAVEVYDSVVAAEGNSIWIFIDKAGKQAVPGNYQFLDYSFSEGLAVVEKDRKKVVINKKGDVVATVDPSWELPFQYGFAKAKNAHLQYGVVNLKGKLVLPIAYDHITILSPNLVQVQKDEQIELYNTKGKKLAQLPYQEVDTLSNGFVKFMVKGKYGLLNREGKQIVSPRYVQIKDFEEGLACVEKDGDWGYINERGKEVIPVKYRSAQSFINGKAAVITNNAERFINKKGRYVDEHYTDFILSNEDLNKETTEKAFLHILNAIVKKYPYAETDEVLIDSLFSINNGFLTGTYRQYTPEGIVMKRLSMPVAKMQEVWYDYNMGFYLEENTGTIQVTNPGETNFVEESTTGMLYLATLKDGVYGWRWKEQLTIALEALKKYYP